MAIVATNLKRGQCIQYEGERGVVLGLEHRTPGKGNALIAATIRSFNSVVSGLEYLGRDTTMAIEFGRSIAGKH